MRTRKCPGIGEPRCPIGVATDKPVGKRISSEKEREYEELHAFLDMYATRFRKIEPDNPAHPTNVGKRIVAEVGKSRALAGLRQAVNDCLEDLQDVAPELVSQLDAELRDAGIVTLSELGRRHSRRYAATLRRGTIRDEAGY